MRGTITLINTTADGTGARGVSRVNQFDQNSRKPSLVFNKCPQLPESPRVLLPALAMPNRSNSVSDTAQVLKGDTPSSVFSLLNNPLADGVVNIGGKASFLLGTLFKQSFSSLRAVGLKFGSNLRVAFSKTIYLPARVGFAIGVRRYVDYAQVYAQKAINIINLWLRGIHNYSKIELPIAQDKVGLPYLSVNSSGLVITDSNRDNLAAAQCKDRYPVKPLPGEDTLVVDHCRMWLKGVLDFFINLVTLRYFSYCAYRHLCRKAIVLSKIMIDSMMEVKLPESLAIERVPRGIVASLIKSLHCLKKSLVLLRARSQLDHQGLLHTYIIEQYIPQCQVKEVVLASSAT